MNCRFLASKMFFLLLLIAGSFFLPFSESAPELAQKSRDKLILMLPHGKSEKLFWENYSRSAGHWLYRWIPRSYSQLNWYHAGPLAAWVLVGNEDDGLFGEGPHALWDMNAAPSCLKAVRWVIRNPLHNYTFYILGSAYRPTDEFVLASKNDRSSQFFLYRPTATTVFSGEGSCFFIGFHSMMPFISFRYLCADGRAVEGFSGWRERGNFGMKMAIRSQQHALKN